MWRLGFLLPFSRAGLLFLLAAYRSVGRGVTYGASVAIAAAGEGALPFLERIAQSFLREPPGLRCLLLDYCIVILGSLSPLVNDRI